MPNLNCILLPWVRQDHLWPIFWKTVTSTSSVKAERILFQLPAMRKISALCGIARSFKKVLSALCHSMWNSSQKFSCRLHAMQHSGESTPRYAAWRDPPLCGIARSWFSSSNLIEYLREIESICKTVFAHESGDPGAQFNEKKNRGSKISWDCPFNWSWAWTSWPSGPSPLPSFVPSSSDNKWYYCE
jgi:hypothetical protein